jgi:ribonuclease P/MRP protein subunit RPP1
MYFDLNVPVNTSSASGKGKGKAAPPPVGQINDKIEILVHCPFILSARCSASAHISFWLVGYTVIALCQTVNKKIEKNHVNFLDEILPGLKKRDGVLILKRLNIILDSDSEKGFGLVRSCMHV